MNCIFNHYDLYSEVYMNIYIWSGVTNNLFSNENENNKMKILTCIFRWYLTMYNMIGTNVNIDPW